MFENVKKVKFAMKLYNQLKKDHPEYIIKVNGKKCLSPEGKLYILRLKDKYLNK